MFARAVVVRVGRAFTLGRKPILNGNDVFVFVGIRVTGISDEDAVDVDRELEGFVLGAFDDSTGRLEVC